MNYTIEQVTPGTGSVIMDDRNIGNILSVPAFVNLPLRFSAVRQGRTIGRYETQEEAVAAILMAHEADTAKGY